MFVLSMWLALLLSTLYFLNTYWCLRRNIARAKASGIRYVVVPFYSHNLLLSLAVRPLLRLADNRFPEPSVTSWRHLVRSNWPWKFRYAPFAELGTDTFLIVSPGGMILCTADAHVISQVMSRGTDFPKATQTYGAVDIYGKNVLTSEGSVWRHHRKITSMAFTENTNRLVWEETIDQSQAMLASWVKPQGYGNTVNQLASDTMRLSLNVISRTGLGQKLEWSDSDADASHERDLPASHTMSFTSSLTKMTKNVMLILVMPKWLMKNSPSARQREAFEAYDEFRKHMQEMIAAKKASLLDSGARESATVISQLTKRQEEGKEAAAHDSNGLTESEVMGNLFILLIAGQDTSSLSIHMSLLLLAMNPEVQRQVWADLQAIFHGKPTSEWEYDRDLPRLLGRNMLNAVVHEQLRLITPVIFVPKWVGAVSQKLEIDGQERTVPTNSIIRLCVSAVHRNPHCWPHGPPKDPKKPYWPPSNVENDLEEFKPERWLKSAAHTGPVAPLSPNRSAQTSNAERISSLETPVRGSYIPFSDGQRACLGRRFAQVEIMTALAVVLSQYTVELAVDEWASDDDVEKMTKDEKSTTWQKAYGNAQWILQNKMTINISLKLQRAHVPVRFVKRGEERFMDL